MTLISMPKRLTGIVYEAYFEFSREVKVTEQISINIMRCNFKANSRREAVIITRDYFYELYEKYQTPVEIKSLTEYNQKTSEQRELKLGLKIIQK